MTSACVHGHDNHVNMTSAQQRTLADIINLLHFIVVHIVDIKGELQHPYIIQSTVLQVTKQQWMSTLIKTFLYHSKHSMSGKKSTNISDE